MMAVRPRAAVPQAKSGDETPPGRAGAVQLELEQSQCAVVTQRVQLAPRPSAAQGSAARGPVGDRSERRMRSGMAARLRVGPGIRRRDRADRDCARHATPQAPVDGAVARGAPAKIAGRREILGLEYAPFRRSAPAARHAAPVPRPRVPCGTLRRRVVRQDRHRLLLATMAPASGLAAMACSVAPVSRSPCSTAQLTGTRPRYFGSSEPCML